MDGGRGRRWRSESVVSLNATPFQTTGMRSPVFPWCHRFCGEVGGGRLSRTSFPREKNSREPFASQITRPSAGNSVTSYLPPRSLFRSIFGFSCQDFVFAIQVYALWLVTEQNFSTTAALLLASGSEHQFMSLGLIRYDPGSFDMDLKQMNGHASHTLTTQPNFAADGL